MTLFVYEEWVVLAVDVVVGTQCVHRNVLLLSLVHGGCTVDTQKGIVVVTSTRWVHS